ncbi:MAG: hypothetical protein GC172_03890 [Phycisphaera sp.]|nr:hypothetical protein [Phycisphaera sp.]
MSQEFRRFVGIGFLAIAIAGAAIASSAVMSSEAQQANERTGGAVTQKPAVEKQEGERSRLDQIGETCWADLRTKRIYIAHTALGRRIVEGAQEVLRSSPEIGLVVLPRELDERDVRQRVRDGDEKAKLFEHAGVYHGEAEHDGEPEDKIEAFEQFLLSPDGAEIDIAMLKLSSSDVSRSTDVTRVLDAYAGAVERIRRARPRLEIVHCTAPLREPDHGARAAIRRMVGAGSDAANATRGRYNDALRKRFAGEVFFDIARAESMRPDGTEATVLVNGERWPALASEYGSGSRDLTDEGRTTLGRELLLTLSACCGESKARRTEGAVTAVPSNGSRGE